MTTAEAIVHASDDAYWAYLIPALIDRVMTAGAAGAGLFFLYMILSAIIESCKPAKKKS